MISTTHPDDSSRLSPRLAALRAEVMARGGSFIADHPPFLADVALFRAWEKSRSVVQIRAALLAEYVNIAPVAVRPGWRLAGEHLIPNPDTPPFHLLDPRFTAQRGRLAEYGLDDAQIAAAEQAARQWAERVWRQPHQTIGERALEPTPGNIWARNGSPVYAASGWMENHSIRDYAKVLRLGYAGIRREVDAEMAALNLTDPTFPQKENFWRAALLVCDAGIRLGQRYAALAAAMAEAAETDAEHSRLRLLADTCARVPAEGARTLHEAVQALWLAHLLTCAEDGINANGLGRLDQMLFPYYQADLAAGRTTPAAARELLAELSCKLYLEYDVQATTLGGVDADGHDAVNDLSYLILAATRDVDFIRPLSVRLHAETPPAFLRQCVEMIAHGGGIPFLFNDTCFIPALVEHGITLADARDYAPIGCIELTIPGKANPHAVSAWFNLLACVVLAIFDGKDPLSGRQLGPHTGTLAEHPTFDAFFAAYRLQVAALAREMVYLTNRGELSQREFGPLPCWSTLTDACIARGRDITDGGAIYNYHSVALLGTANTADALMAVRQLVYLEQTISPAALMDALATDFTDAEALRVMLLAQAPKYGNDHDAVDALARTVAEDFITLMDDYRSPLGGRYVVHLFSYLLHISFGAITAATPDGRHAGDPLAYSLSAHQGRDAAGVTAMLRSLAKLPHARAAGASAAIIELDPKLIAGDEGIARLQALIQAAFSMGVGQLQWNITTAERLQLAQDDPEHYGNLHVRVAGYSQLFRLIPRDLQNHIIARTKHTE